MTTLIRSALSGLLIMPLAGKAATPVILSDVLAGIEARAAEVRPGSRLNQWRFGSGRFDRYGLLN